MGDTVDPISIIQVSPAGVAMCGTTRFSDSEHPEIGWFIRAESSWIKEMAEQVTVEMHAGSIYEDNVCLIPVLIAVGVPNEQNIFETWINIHQKGENPLTLLSRQNRITIQFYGDSGKAELVIKIPNSLRDLAQKVLKETIDLPGWSLAQFEAARKKSYEKYPTVMQLWRSLASDWCSMEKC